ncbi:MAG: hypothetical protein QNI98_03595 [Woeseiaceae bacterium]|nr:hypothetical protein [Woeseiaceae bacterium]
MKTYPLLLGKDRRLFGVCTTPSNHRDSLGAIILNAGLLHNVGPFRLHVNLAHDLAELGIPSIRLDQSGKGESPARSELNWKQSVLQDYDDAFVELQKLGVNRSILIGLCSGADDAMQIVSQRTSVCALLMFDGYARKTSAFEARKKAESGGTLKSLLRSASYPLRSLRGIGKSKKSSVAIDLRDWDSDEEMTGILTRFVDNGGHIFAVFTPGQDYYNYEGQFVETVSHARDSAKVREVYFDDTDHTFSRVAHRERLRADVVEWAKSLVDEPD